MSNKDRPDYTLHLDSDEALINFIKHMLIPHNSKEYTVVTMNNTLTIRCSVSDMNKVREEIFNYLKIRRPFNE